MKTVLVVDDEHGVAEVIAFALEDAGYRVVSASNGREALMQMAATMPDLVLSDNMMPVLDGPGMVREIRSRAEYAQIPIILMSAVPSFGSLAEMEGIKFLQKPFRLEEVVKAVNQALSSDSRA